MGLLRHLAALRPGPLTSTIASARTSLRAIARRWLALDAEVKDHDASLGQLIQQLAPDLMHAHGMGGRNRRRNAHPRRRQSRAHPFGGGPGQAPRRLPGPSLQRQDNPAPPQPWRQSTGECRPTPGGHRPHAWAPTHPRPRQAPHRRGKGQARDPFLPPALRRPRDLQLPLSASPSTPDNSKSPLATRRASTPILLIKAVKGLATLCRLLQASLIQSLHRKSALDPAPAGASRLRDHEFVAQLGSGA